MTHAVGGREYRRTRRPAAIRTSRKFSAGTFDGVSGVLAADCKLQKMGACRKANGASSQDALHKRKRRCFPHLKSSICTEMGDQQVQHVFGTCIAYGEMLESSYVVGSFIPAEAKAWTGGQFGVKREAKQSATDGLNVGIKGLVVGVPIEQVGGEVEDMQQDKELVGAAEEAVAPDNPMSLPIMTRITVCTLKTSLNAGCMAGSMIHTQQRIAARIPCLIEKMTLTLLLLRCLWRKRDSRTDLIPPVKGMLQDSSEGVAGDGRKVADMQQVGGEVDGMQQDKTEGVAWYGKVVHDMQQVGGEVDGMQQYKTEGVDWYGKVVDDMQQVGGEKVEGMQHDNSEGVAGDGKVEDMHKVNNRGMGASGEVEGMQLDKEVGGFS